MSQTGKLSERSQQILLDIQSEYEKISIILSTVDTELDKELLEKVFTYHMHRSQESMILLCKLLEDYQRGVLNSTSLLALALLT